jgi:hypothetical protein
MGNKDTWTTDKPKRSNWNKHIVLCVSEDLDQHAKARIAKRIIAGDGNAQNLKLILFGSPLNIPDNLTGDDARLIVIGHGDEESSTFAGFSMTGKKPSLPSSMSPETLVTKLAAALNGKRLGRVALRNCWGAGNPVRGIDLSMSFAWQFARCCSFATTVTAFAAEVRNQHTMQEKDPTKPTGHCYTQVRDEGKGVNREKQAGDKVILYPQFGASVQNQIDPEVRVPTYETIDGQIDLGKL